MGAMRKKISHSLICLADRICPEETFRHTGFSYRFVPHVGVVFSTEEGGIPIWVQDSERWRGFRAKDGWDK